VFATGGYVGRTLSSDPSLRKPVGAFPFSPWFRSLLLIVVCLVAAEFGLRCFSYHRALMYEAAGRPSFYTRPGPARRGQNLSVVNHQRLRIARRTCAAERDAGRQP